ncbi:hypothetical protein KSP40_PGU010305 [Platanthera guangdongensis]|uniref:Legume lectin domain-containing protein n=1 Tax=Platanthera guangdongensis TaxID=2320717 RepID=A0ABR2N1K1_9ASPA
MSISVALLALFLSLADLSPETQGSEAPLSFTFEQFRKNGTSAIALLGDALVEDSAVRMTRAGKILYRKPVQFLRGNNGFSTYFSFSILPSGSNNLAFFLDSADWRLFPLSKNVLLVRFLNNDSGSRIGVRLGRNFIDDSCNVSDINILMSNGTKQHSWVDYDGVSKKIEVRLSKSRALRPSRPFISCPIDNSGVLQEEALHVGISSSSDYSRSTGKNSTQRTSIYTWSFLVKHGDPCLLHSEPLDPRSYLVSSQDRSSVFQGSSYRWSSLMTWLFGLVCGVLIALIAVSARNAISRPVPVIVVDYPLHHAVDLY